MVLIRPAAVLLVAAACNQSLFDARGPRRDGGPGDGGSDADIPTTCPAATCIADAAADFDGTPGGIGDRWRYYEDRRDRSWTPMTSTGGAAVGAEAGNQIRKCSSGSSPACQALPDALLISSSGLAADPALAYTSPGAGVIQLAVRVRVPSGADQRVRLYRNSREDVLFAGDAPAGATVAHAITVDALAGDRFMLALEPRESPGAAAAVHFFVIDAGRAFPSTCQLAASFSEAVGNLVQDLCTGRDFTSKIGGVDMPPDLLDSGGPFPEQGRLLHIGLGSHLQAPEEPKLIRNGGPLTVQFWVRLDDVPSGMTGHVVSDIDLDLGGGASLGFFGVATMYRIQVEADGEAGEGTTPTSDDVPFRRGEWRFVRMVDTPGEIAVCIDGARAMTLPVAPDRPESGYPLHLGKNSGFQTTPVFEGRIDDVRVFAAALPCN